MIKPITGQRNQPQSESNFTGTTKFYNRKGSNSAALGLLGGTAGGQAAGLPRNLAI